MVAFLTEMFQIQCVQKAFFTKPAKTFGLERVYVLEDLSDSDFAMIWNFLEKKKP